MSAIRLSVVIPCYNEAKNIPLLLERLSASIPGSGIEVVLVNNGSTDDSQAVIERLLPSHPFARCVVVPVNQGYGFGILSGLRAGKGEFLAWTHADLQTDPADLSKALAIAQAHATPENVYVKGSRKGRPLFDAVFTAGMSFFESLYFRTPLRDINAQPNLFHRDFFARWDAPPHDFSLDLFALWTARRDGLAIERFPVVFPPRIHGTSSWNTGLASKWKFIKRTLAFSRELKSRL